MVRIHPAAPLFSYTIPAPATMVSLISIKPEPRRKGPVDLRHSFGFLIWGLGALISSLITLVILAFLAYMLLPIPLNAGIGLAVGEIAAITGIQAIAATMMYMGVRLTGSRYLRSSSLIILTLFIAVALLTTIHEWAINPGC